MLIPLLCLLAISTIERAALSLYHAFLARVCKYIPTSPASGQGERGYTTTNPLPVQGISTSGEGSGNEVFDFNYYTWPQSHTVFFTHTRPKWSNLTESLQTKKLNN